MTDTAYGNIQTSNQYNPYIQTSNQYNPYIQTLNPYNASNPQPQESMSSIKKILIGFIVFAIIVGIIVGILAATGLLTTENNEDTDDEEKKKADEEKKKAEEEKKKAEEEKKKAEEEKKKADESKTTMPPVTPPPVTPPPVNTPPVTPPPVNTPPVNTPPVTPPPVTPPPVTPPPVTPNNIPPTPPGVTTYALPTGINYVSGYSGGTFDDFLSEQGQTPEKCRQLALTNKDKYAAWGYRTPEHPDSKSRNTCFLYKKPFLPYLGDSKDKIHVTGCLNPNEKVEWGCATSKPTNILSAGIKWVRGFVNSDIDDPREKGQTEESCRLKALENKDKYGAWGFRTKDHPDESLRNTCIFYKKPFPMFPGNTTDFAHVTGCLNPDERVEWGCSTTAPTSSVFMPNKQPIKSRQNNECIDVHRASTANEEGVDTYGCHGGDNQKWTYDSKNRLIAAHSGKCLTIRGGKDVRPVQRDCTDGNGQKWYYEPSTQRLISVDNGLCLDRPGDGRITMWDCHNGDNQKWYL